MDFATLPEAHMAYCPNDERLRYAQRYVEWFAGRPVPKKILDFSVTTRLQVWRDWFKGAKVLGVCNDLELANRYNFGPLVATVAMDTAAPEFPNEFAQAWGQRWGLVVDSATRGSFAVVETFQKCFRFVGVGGVWVIEDLGVAYLPEYNRDNWKSLFPMENCVDLLRALLDVVNDCGRDKFTEPRGPIMSMHFWKDIVFIERKLDQTTRRHK